MTPREEIAAIQTVSLSLFRFAPVHQRLWAFTQMGLARRDLWRLPEVRFWKLCGSGLGHGFLPVPNTAIAAILATWPDGDAARRGTARAPVFARFRRHAADALSLFLSPRSVRGAWSGRAPFEPEDGAAGPLAVLTRASIRPHALGRFWGHTPAVDRAIGENPDALFKIGLGEVPWLHQITFSVWPDAGAMDRFAHAAGPHRRAVRAVRAARGFREELYARFVLTGLAGSWRGLDPRLRAALDRGATPTVERLPA